MLGGSVRWLIIVVAFTLVGCTKTIIVAQSPSPPPSPSPSPPASAIATYEVLPTGNQTADTEITYDDGTGTTVTIHATPPWTFNIRVSGEVSLSLDAKTSFFNPLSCEVLGLGLNPIAGTTRAISSGWECTIKQIHGTVGG